MEKNILMNEIKLIELKLNLLKAKIAGEETKINPSTPRSEARGLPFDKLKAPSLAEGLGVDTERRS